MIISEMIDTILRIVKTKISMLDSTLSSDLKTYLLMRW